MIRVVLLVGVLLVPTVQAGSDTGSVCGEVYKVAEMIMTGRQEGHPMPLMMEAANSEPAAVALVKAAYAKSRYSTASYKERSVQEFANSSYLACLNASDK